MKSQRPGRSTQAIKSVFLAVATSLAAATALATTVTGPSPPIAIQYNNTGIIYVYFPVSIRSGTVPACATNIGGTLYRLVFDSTTPGGKSMLAGLITSMATGYQLWPLGSGDCGVDNANESLVNIYQFNN